MKKPKRDAKNAQNVLKNKGSHIIAKEEYLNVLDSFTKTYTAVTYDGKNKAILEY